MRRVVDSDEMFAAILIAPGRDFASIAEYFTVCFVIAS